MVPDVALELEHVRKKFKKGETYDSLRDLLSALPGRLLARGQENLGKGEFWALDDVSFRVSRGEAFGIIGPNGSGKSTIMKLLSKIMKPTSGRIAVDGRLSALIEVGAGFHPDLTGRENIFLNGTILGMSRDEIRKKMDQIIDFSGISDFIDAPVKRYSSGMYARLGFSVAAHVDPDILLVDEVLSVGDFVFQRKCNEKMQSVIQEGATVIFISHNLKAVSELCTRSLLLDHGRVLTEGQTGEVIRTYLDSAAEKREDSKLKPVYISQVRFYGQKSDTVHFKSGDDAFLEVEVIANRNCEKLAVVIGLTDENQYRVFDTSTERLGHGSFSLKAGEHFNCSFQLKLMLASGTFHFGVYVYRYDTQQEFDRWAPAATLYVSSEYDVRGAVNLFPKVVASEVQGIRV
jgi:lipopolysaccharide transport system ATP-binding protein